MTVPPAGERSRDVVGRNRANPWYVWLGGELRVYVTCNAAAREFATIVPSRICSFL